MQVTKSTQRVDNTTLWKNISLEQMYFFVVFLFAARASILTSNLDPRTNPIGVLIYVVPGLYIAYRDKLKPSTTMYIIWGLYLVWAAIQKMTATEFKIMEYCLFPLHITVAYLIVTIFKKNTFYYFEKITTIMAGISLLGWGVMQIVGSTTLGEFCPFEAANSTSIGSFIVFNVPDTERYEDAGLFGLDRNCGCCWEPGMFASFLIMAIFFNLCRTKNKLIDNTSLYILLVALFTTFSTTGYVALIIILTTHFFYDTKLLKNEKNLILIPVFAVFAYQMYQLPFMKEKIKDRADEESYVNDNINKLKAIEESEEQVTVDRFEGLALDFTNWQDKPLFGYGLNRANSYVSRELSELIVISNGITSPFSSFGTIIGLLIYIGWILNSIFIRRLFRVKDKAFFWVFITISMSYSFFNVALFIAIGQYYILCQPSRIKLFEPTEEKRRREILRKYILLQQLKKLRQIKEHQ